jgi:hypothetical protein
MSGEKTLTEVELDERLSSLRTVLDTDGARACCANISSEPDDSVRNQLFRFVIRKLGGRTGATAKDLDDMVLIGEAAIENALRIAERRPDEADQWRDQANISMFNLSANLCDCWGDGDSRELRHFEAGLRFADHALDLRRQLKKGPGPFAMAFWARGKHLLSLKRPVEAADAFRNALENDQKILKEKESTPQAPETTPSVLMDTAFLGFSLMRAGKAEGASMLESALTNLRMMTESSEDEVRDDAQLYVDEIQETMRHN